MNDKFTQFLAESKKEIFIFFCSLFFVLSVMKVSSFILIDLNNDEVDVASAEVSIGYRLFVEDVDLGLVLGYDDAEGLVKEAMSVAIDELGYEAQLEPKVRIYEEEIDTATSIDDREVLVKDIKKLIIDNMDDVKIKAYAMKIGEDFVVALQSKDEVKEVLENAQRLYVSDNTDFEIQLISDPHNGLVETPKVLMKEAADDSVFLMAAASGEEETDSEEEAETEEETSESAGTTVGIEFSEDVMVVEAFVSQSKVYSVDEATEMITKENQEPKKYLVQSGDYPGKIAQDNEMTLDQLYSMNAGLKEKENSLQIGQELIVQTLEPELSVSTKEEVVYKTEIQRETTYRENANKFTSYEKVIDNGANGEMEITAVLTKVNGRETERTIINEKVVLEPVNKIVEKGSKPLPPKGSTGRYIKPLTSYVVTSGFGYRWGRLHTGVDMGADTGTPIRATDGGVVTYAGWRSSYGYLIIINHGGGVESRYAHCSSIGVSVGQQVAQYQQIGRVGNTGRSTGPHLHFELRFDGTPVNPLSYLSY